MEWLPVDSARGQGGGTAREGLSRVCLPVKKTVVSLEKYGYNHIRWTFGREILSMEEVNMLISGIIRKKGEKFVRVSFQRNQDMAEYILPECRLDKSRGFSKEELKQLENYVKNDRTQIMEEARKVNPMKAMLGMNE